MGSRKESIEEANYDRIEVKLNSFLNIETVNLRQKNKR